MQHFSLEDIQSMKRDYRRNFINTISGFRPTNLIGTLSYQKVANVAIFNSVMHIGANPPLLGFIMRPLTVPRQTYHNIKAQGCFTINAVTASFMEMAHQTSAKYDAHTSEFEATGLTPHYTKQIAAPYVKESPVQIGLELEEEQEIKANGSILIVGKVVELMVASNLLDEEGYFHPEKVQTLAVSGLDRYYLPQFKAQLEYARPDNNSNRPTGS